MRRRNGGIIGLTILSSENNMLTAKASIGSSAGHHGAGVAMAVAKSSWPWRSWPRIFMQRLASSAAGAAAAGSRRRRYHAYSAGSYTGKASITGAGAKHVSGQPSESCSQPAAPLPARLRAPRARVYGVMKIAYG